MGSSRLSTAVPFGGVRTAPSTTGTIASVRPNTNVRGVESASHGPSSLKIHHHSHTGEKPLSATSRAVVALSAFSRTCDAIRSATFPEARGRRWSPLVSSMVMLRVAATTAATGAGDRLRLLPRRIEDEPDGGWKRQLASRSSRSSRPTRPIRTSRLRSRPRSRSCSWSCAWLRYATRATRADASPDANADADAWQGPSAAVAFGVRARLAKHEHLDRDASWQDATAWLSGLRARSSS